MGGATLASGFLVGVAVLLLIAHTAGLHPLAILFLVAGIVAVLVLSLWWARAMLRRPGG